MVSSTSNQFNPIRPEGQAQSAAPVKTGRFGLPVADAATAKISDLGTKTPATNLNGDMKEITFSGKPMVNGSQAKEEKASFIFKNTQEKSLENKPPRSGEIIIRNPGQPPNGQIKDSNPAQVTNQNVKEIGSINFMKIKSDTKAGKAQIGRINDQKGTIEIEKLNKNIDLSKDKNIVLIYQGIIIPNPNRENNQNLRDYKLVTKDPALKSEMEHIQENFRNSTIYIATHEEFNILNQINQSRIENPQDQDPKKDDSSLKDNKKVDTKPQQSETLKIKEDNSQKNQSTQFKQGVTLRSTSNIDDEKTDKATTQKQNEEIRMKKKEEDIKASLLNEEKIDERVLSRLKNQKN